jgi:fermentation-respiration switch protein FrsA (DUF1100 family)
MFAEVRRAGLDAYRLAPQVQCPVLVLQGTQDDLVLPHLTYQLTGRFSGMARYVEVDASHDLINPCHAAWSEVAGQALLFAQSANGLMAH